MKTIWNTPFYYCLYRGREIIRDENGYEIGEGVAYEEPVKMCANVSAASGYSSVEQFGNLDNYDKVILTTDMACPIDENAVLFIDKEPESNSDGQYTYDYVVRRVAKTLNVIAIAISKVRTS